MSTATYADDLTLLRKHTGIIELASGQARVAVAPAYQGRVMTSTLAGQAGASFGWLNAGFVASGKADPRFHNYGGEDRFWLGPEAGQFGLWFRKSEPFDTAHWKTPPGFDTQPFRLAAREEASATLAAEFDVTNYSGTAFHCRLQRIISLLENPAGQLRIAMPAGVSAVAFESKNILANAGSAEWAARGGLLSVWVLGQFKPLPRGKVIVPFVAGDDESLGPKATTDYFGPLPPERCRIAEDHLLFACDGRYRSKIGISPARAKDVLGSYDPDAGVLTIVQFNLPSDAARRPYVNSLWKMQEEPFAGDAVNSYNDGEETPGAGQLGPFYEIETSSPAAALKPGQTLTHVHRTFHFAGPPEALRQIAQAVLGVDPK